MSDLNTAQTPFPRLGTPMVDENRFVAAAWYRLFIDMWRKLGQSHTLSPNAIALQLDQTTGQVQVVDANTGAILGDLAYSSTSGGPVEPVVLVGSPHTYRALKSGTLLLGSGKSSLSRDGGVNFIPVSLVGCAIPMLANDQALLEWYSADPPLANFFPNS